jgi:CRISPR/Cas system-associated exonuclease Cas4 (RecB family)
MSRHENSDVIRASELGEYVYCARAWWLRRVQGVASRNVAALDHGQRAHDRHGRAVAAVQTQRRVALLLAVLALLLLLAAGAVSLVGGGL